MAWMSVQDFAASRGISRQAVLKAIKNGKLQTREVPGRNQHGVSYEVYAEATTDNRQPEATTDNRQPEATTDNRQPEATTDNRQPEATTDNLTTTETTETTSSSPCEMCKSAHPSCDGCCRICTDQCNSGQMCHRLVEHSKRAQVDLTGRPNGWEKIYDSLVDTPFMRPKIPEATGMDGVEQVDSCLRRNDGQDLESDAVGERSSHVPFTDGIAGSNPAGVAIFAETIGNEADGTCKKSLQVQEDQPLSTVVMSDKAEFESYPKAARDRAFARLEIVKTWIDEKRRAKVDGVNISAIEQGFLQHLEQGKLCFEATELLRREGDVRLSIRTIYRWEKAWREAGSIYPICLVDKYNRSKIDKDNQYARTFIKMMAADPREHHVNEIMRQAGQKVPGFDMSYRTVARIVQEARKDKLLIAAITGPTAYKNNARPHIRRINDCMPGDKFEADGKTMNVLVMSPFWFHNDKSLRYIVRPVIVCWLDIATWTIVGWATWLSESFHLVRTSFVDAMSKGGVPKCVTYDGGGSFHNIYTNPEWFASRKRDTAATRKARELVSKGYRGFYEQFGVEKQVKTIPGNSESKQIEPAWGNIFGDWEKRQFAYVGKDFSARPEWLRMTNMKLIKTYKDKIMTWDEYVSSVGDYINEWNNRPRPSLTRLDGSVASPIEAYMEFQDQIRKPSIEVIEHACWHPRKTVVQRDGVYLDGLLYRHPGFGVYLGQSVLVEYDERNRFECTIATPSGEKFSTPARLVIPGMHMDDEQSKLAMIDRAHYEKELKAVYLARVNHGESITMHEFNSLTSRVDQLLEDQSRRQEKEKDSQGLIQERTAYKNKPAKAIESSGFESIEDEFATMPAITEEIKDQDEDDLFIDEISKELNDIGIRSTR